jgi:hypothetical protein
MKKISDFLAWLRVTDAHDGMLSLTNIVLWVMVFKLAMLQTFTLPDLASFFLALLAYSHKRWVSSKVSVVTEQVAAAVKATSELGDIKAQLQDHKAKFDALVGTVALGTRR